MLLSEMLVKSTAPSFLPLEPHCFRNASKYAKIKDNRMYLGLSVRRARASDLPRILAIERASFGSDAYDRKLFAEYLLKCGDLFLVAMWGDKVIAYAITCIHPNAAELVSIAVAPRHRSRGAASALLDRTMRRLRRLGIPQFTLMVKVSNAPALAFYEKHGFQQTHRIRRYYEDSSDGFRFVKLL
jgi:ribosomal-protein-alanine N-acetyltransferase